MNLYTKVYLDKLAGAKWDAAKNVTKSVFKSRPFKAALVRYAPEALIKQLPEEYQLSPENMNRVNTLAATAAGAVVPGKGSSTTAKAIGAAAGLAVNQFAPSIKETYKGLTDKVDASTPSTPSTSAVPSGQSSQELTDKFQKIQQTASEATKAFDQPR